MPGTTFAPTPHAIIEYNGTIIVILFPVRYLFGLDRACFGAALRYNSASPFPSWTSSLSISLQPPTNPAPAKTFLNPTVVNCCSYGYCQQVRIKRRNTESSA